MPNVGADKLVVVTKPVKAGGAKGLGPPGADVGHPQRKESTSESKSYSISKHLVHEAYQKVRANGGSAGVDGQTLEMFGERLEDNLYKIWNRMSSGSYRPPPVKFVEIPKGNGGTRILGVPTVSDRIAQMVVKMVLEPLVEPVFHAGSYGYRSRRSALQAVGQARERCWRHDWVIDLDIKGFFDNLDHALVEKAVARHTDLAWVKLYIGRWLRAPLQKADGTLVERTKGTPQGGVISPLLANLFLHYVFDAWMSRYHPGIPFERYADDAIVHCGSEREAVEVLEAIRKRFAECGLELHPEKTRIVYCKDDDRPGNPANTSFDFLGYTFRPRGAKSRRGRFFLSFLPAMSDKAANSVRGEIRAWKLPSKCCGQSMEEIARVVNPKLNGWLNYFGRYYRSECTRVLGHFNERLAEWARRKYKGISHGLHFLGRVAKQAPRMFALWQHGVMPATGG